MLDINKNVFTSGQFSAKLSKNVLLINACFVFLIAYLFLLKYISGPGTFLLTSEQGVESVHLLLPEFSLYTCPDFHFSVNTFDGSVPLGDVEHMLRRWLVQPAAVDRPEAAEDTE